jgi:hypothetical protein
MPLGDSDGNFKNCIPANFVDVRGSVRHSTIHKEKSNKMQQYINIYYSTWQRPPTARPTTFHVWKTRGYQCSFRLLMMGGVSPQSVFSFTYIGNNKMLIHCCILLDFAVWISGCSLGISIATSHHSASDPADGPVFAHSRVSVPFTPLFRFNLTHPRVGIYYISPKNTV